jgi:hypothetical protein
MRLPDGSRRRGDLFRMDSRMPSLAAPRQQASESKARRSRQATDKVLTLFRGFGHNCRHLMLFCMEWTFFCVAGVRSIN